VSRFASRLDYAFWRLPLAVHYGWASVVFLLEAVTGSSNPRTFENVAKLRRERIAAHSSEDVE
jgi:hypothetical protein